MFGAGRGGGDAGQKRTGLSRSCESLSRNDSRKAFGLAMQFRRGGTPRDKP